MWSSVQTPRTSDTVWNSLTRNDCIKNVNVVLLFEQMFLWTCSLLLWSSFYLRYGPTFRKRGGEGLYGDRLFIITTLEPVCKVLVLAVCSAFTSGRENSIASSRVWLFQGNLHKKCACIKLTETIFTVTSDAVYTPWMEIPLRIAVRSQERSSYLLQTCVRNASRCTFHHVIVLWAHARNINYPITTH